MTRHGGPVAGVDEVGRGPWAGPVVAAAVVLKADAPDGLLGALNDSKKLPAARREALAAAIPDHAWLGVGAASVTEIDRLNILAASHLAAFQDNRILADIGRRLRGETPYATEPRAPLPGEYTD